MNKFIISLTAFLTLVVCNIQGQNLDLQDYQSDELAQCHGDGVIHFQLQNNAENYDSVFVEVQLPSGLEFQSLSATAGISVFNNDLVHPILFIDGMAINDIGILDLTVRAGCGTDSVANVTFIRRVVTSTSNTTLPAIVRSLSVDQRSVTILSDILHNGSVLAGNTIDAERFDVFGRTICIVNNSSFPLDSFTLFTYLDTIGKIESVDVGTVVTYDTVGGVHELFVGPNDIPLGLDAHDTIYITQTVKVLTCCGDSLGNQFDDASCANTTFDVQWGCNEVFCQSYQEISDIEVDGGQAKLIVGTSPIDTFCYGIEVIADHTAYVLHNTNSRTAYNVQFVIKGATPNSSNGYSHTEVIDDSFMIRMAGSTDTLTLDTDSMLYEEFSSVCNPNDSLLTHAFFSFDSLAVGDSLYIFYQTYTCIPNDTCTGGKMGGIQYDMGWENLCGVPDSRNGYDLFTSVNEQGWQCFEDGPTDLVGSFDDAISDGEEATFEFVITNPSTFFNGNHWYNEIGDVNSAIELKFKVPNCAMLLDSNSVNLTWTQDGDTWQPYSFEYDIPAGIVTTRYSLHPSDFDIGSAFANKNFIGSVVNITLKTDCKFNPTCAAKSIVVLQIGHVPDKTSCPEKVIPKACCEWEFNIHCPGCLRNGITVNNFSMERTSYGLPDNLDNGTVNGTALLLDSLNLGRAMLGDTVVGHVETHIDNGNNFHPNPNTPFTHGYYELNFNDAGHDAYFQPLATEIRIFDFATGLTHVGIIPVSLILQNPANNPNGDVSVFYDYSIDQLDNFNFSPALNTGTYTEFKSGDYVEIFPKFRVVHNVGTSLVKVLMSNHAYLSVNPYTATIASTLIPDEQLWFLADTGAVPIPDGTYILNDPLYDSIQYFCEDHGGKFYLTGYVMDNVAGLSSTTNTNEDCDQRFLNIRPQVTSGFDNLYPYEFRVFSIFDSLRVELPPFHTVDSLTADIGNNTFVLVDTSYYILTPDTLIFSFVDWAEDNGYQSVFDESHTIHARMFFQPDCSIRSAPINDEIEMASEASYTIPFHHADLDDGIVTNKQIRKYEFNHPLVVIDIRPDNFNPDSLTLGWLANFSLDNQNNLAPLENYWVSFVSQSNNVYVDSVIITTSLGLVSPANVTGNIGEEIYQLGHVDDGDSLLITVYGDYLSCVPDEVIMYTGWDCKAYPTTLSDTICTPRQDTIIITPVLGDLAVTVDKITPDIVEGCDSIGYLISISPNTGRFFDVFSEVNLGQDLTIAQSGVTILSPFGNDTVVVYPNAVSNVASWSYDTLGIDTLSIALGDTISAYFYLYPDCDYIGGSPIDITTIGESSCHEIQQFQADENLPPYHFPIDSLLIMENFTTLAMTCTESFTAEYVITNALMPTLHDNTFHVELPYGLHVDQLTFNVAPALVEIVNGLTEITWNIPAMSDTDSVAFTFDVFSNNYNVCEDFSLNSFISASDTIDCPSTVGFCTRIATMDSLFILLDYCCNFPCEVDGGNDTVLCNNEPLVLFATGSDTYTWSNGTANGGTFFTSVTDTLIVESVDSLQCESSDTIIVLVYPTDLIDAGLDVTTCSNELTTLTATGGTGFTWNNGVTDGASFLPTISGDYTVSGTDSNGCIGMDTLVLTINALPIVDGGPIQKLCFGTTTILSGSGADTYVWNGGVLDGVPFTPTGIFNYELTGTDTNGCQGLDVVPIQVSSELDAEFLFPDSICIADTLNLVSQSQVNEYWNMGDGTIFTTSSIEHSYSAIGSFDITHIVDSFGCADTVVHSIVINENCCSIQTDSVMGNPNALTVITGNHTYTGSYLIRGDIEFQNGDVTLDGATFYMDGNAQRSTTANYFDNHVNVGTTPFQVAKSITIHGPNVIGPNIFLNKVDFVMIDAEITSACDTVWGGIYSTRDVTFPNSLGINSIRITGITDSSRISNSAYGLSFQSKKDLVFIDKTLFYNNVYSSINAINDYSAYTNDDTIQNCLFDCDPQQMLIPFEYINSNQHFYSHTGINVYGDNRFFQVNDNDFRNQLHGIASYEGASLSMNRNHFIGYFSIGIGVGFSKADTYGNNITGRTTMNRNVFDFPSAYDHNIQEQYLYSAHTAYETQGRTFGICTNGAIDINENDFNGQKDHSNQMDQFAISYHSPGPASNQVVVISNNTIDELHHGIHCITPWTRLDAQMKGNLIDNVEEGISIESGKFFDIKSNVITNIPNEGYDTYGIKLIGVSSVNVFENTFTGSGNGVIGGPASHGIVVQNSGSDNTILFKNSFSSGIDIGIQAQGDNSGLKIRCNQFAADGTPHGVGSLVVLKVGSFGALLNQGNGCATPEDQAGNTFGDICGTSGSEKDVYVEDGIDFDYFHQNPVTSPEVFPFCSSNTSPDFWKNINLIPCPTQNFNSTTSCSNPFAGMIVNPNDNPIGFLDEVAVKAPQLDAEINGGSILLEAGDAQDLKDDVDADVSAGQLKNKMIQASPYLSDGVMIHAFESKPTPMPAGHVKEVAVANSPLSADVIACIESLDLPKGIKKQIEDNQFGENVRDLLIREVKGKTALKRERESEVVSIYLEQEDIASAKAVLEASVFPESKKTLAELELTTAEFNDARTIVNDVASSGELEDVKYAELMNVVIDIAELDASIVLDSLPPDSFVLTGLAGMTATQEAIVRSVANSNTLVATQAEAVLSIAFGEEFEHPIMKIPAGSAKWSGEEDQQADEQVSEEQEGVDSIEKEEYFRLYPNPNDGNFVLEYSYDTDRKAVFYMYDVLGKNIKTIDLTGNGQNVTINENNLFNGLYFYELRVNGRIVKTDKLLIIK